MSLAATAPTSRSKVIGFWFFKIVFGLAFIAAGCAKIYGPPAMVAEFDAVGLGQWFRYFTGALEIIGAIMLLTSTTGFGALLLAGICGGAFFAQLLALSISSIRSQWASSLSPLLGTSAIRCWARSVDSRPRAFFIDARSIAHSLAHRSPPVSNCL
jgi:putative oxidoreductase